VGTAINIDKAFETDTASHGRHYGTLEQCVTSLKVTEGCEVIGGWSGSLWNVKVDCIGGHWVTGPLG
jgi:hypothetical protein